MELLKDVVARWQFTSDECDMCRNEHDLDEDCPHSEYCDCDWCLDCACCGDVMADCTCDHARGDWCDE